MSRPHYLTRMLAVPAAVALALGGALLVAAPAQAAVGDSIAVASPANGATAVPRQFDVVGTGSDGASVTVTDSAGTTVGTATIAAGGAFTAPVTIASAAPDAQTLTITQLVPATDPLPGPTSNSTQVAITLAPAAVIPAGVILVDAPLDGAVLDSRFVTVEGSAPAGSTLEFSTNGDLLDDPSVDDAIVIGDPIVPADGGFAVELFFSIEADVAQTITVGGTDADGGALEPVDRDVILPAALAAPVITAPITGSSTTGSTITFSGTGIPGENIVLIVAPTDAASAAAFAAVDATQFETPIVVGPDGRWTATYTLSLGNFTSAAFHATLVAGELGEITSPISNEVTFSLVAPPVVAPAVVRPVAVLAATGATTDGLIAPASALLVLGLVLVAATRRRAGASD